MASLGSPFCAFIHASRHVQPYIQLHHFSHCKLDLVKNPMMTYPMQVIHVAVLTPWTPNGSDTINQVIGVIGGNMASNKRTAIFEAEDVAAGVDFYLDLDLKGTSTG